MNPLAGQVLSTSTITELDKAITVTIAGVLLAAIGGAALGNWISRR